MIRYTKHFNTDYIIIDSHIEVEDLIIPIQVQVNINSIRFEERFKVHRIVNAAFNRVISFNKPKKKNPWYKFW